MKSTYLNIKNNFLLISSIVIFLILIILGLLSNPFSDKVINTVNANDYKNSSENINYNIDVTIPNFWNINNKSSKRYLNTQKDIQVYIIKDDQICDDNQYLTEYKSDRGKKFQECADIQNLINPHIHPLNALSYINNNL